MKLLMMLIIGIIIPINAQATNLNVLFIKHAKKYELKASLLESLCFIESSHNSNAITFDGDSASLGLCQVKIGTARLMGYKGNVSDLWHNDDVNIQYAAKYLKHQLNRYKDLKKAISAYNAGSYTTKNHKYVEKVLRYARRSL